MPVRREKTKRGATADQIAGIRRFNRFYTRLVGALGDGYLDSPLSLSEGRVLFELAHRESPTAAVLVEDLGLDAGYMSRLIRRLERRRLVKRTRSAVDGRQSHLALTAAGRSAFRALDTKADQLVAELIDPIETGDRRRLLDAMRTVSTLLGANDSPAASTIVLRPPRAGDFGWVVYRHGVLYSTEYGWNQRFEALVARVVADYLESHDPRLECCWIAERDGERVGSVFVMKDPQRPGVAKLRLLFVEQSARGHGIGRRLVDECTRFARHAGYHTISLWTNSVLTAARRIYAEAGYHRVKEEVHDTFGQKLTAETWEMSLRPEP
ncbi:MAG TPA: helix-turn-helix domain-containing GNAT family N-acetyltransferase [Gemmatimonadaceae bacterium]|nr:helix-turn-helix domain-containing GNAT family N-acetyltransferase [Gemmatimonadaceae bacterium]